ncbi:MAG: hypothetical protein J0L82_10350 [Deltaproteobacteria bacterium]|jgi:hypothetical protein|nr:hypothetical protein [Deltaproteobacteria bacterium]
MNAEMKELEPIREVLKTLLKTKNVNIDTAFSELDDGFLVKTKTAESSIVCLVYRIKKTQITFINFEVAFATGSYFELIKMKALIEETLKDIPVPFRPIIENRHIALQIRTPACWITDTMLTEAIDCLLHSSEEFLVAALERGLLVTSFRSEEHDPDRVTDLAKTRTLN